MTGPLDAGGAPLLFTVGHGTRTIAQLVVVLEAAGAGRVVDVRRFPSSRRHPHFNREALARSLSDHGIGYAWRGDDLGGRRSVDPGSTSRHHASPRTRADATGRRGQERRPWVKQRGAIPTAAEHVVIQGEGQGRRHSWAGYADPALSRHKFYPGRGRPSLDQQE